MKVIGKQHARFIEEYLKDGNATQAATRAGYSVKTARSQGQRLLTRADINREIEKARAQISKRNAVTVDKILSDLKEIKERCMQAIPVKDKEGNFTGEWKFDAKGAIKACELLGRHIGMWRDNFTVSFDPLIVTRPIAGKITEVSANVPMLTAGENKSE